MAYVIETGVPVQSNYAVRSPLRITLAKMKVGDSIVVNCKSRQHAHNCADKESVEIITRKISRDQVRIWRVK